jgi:hypothetical protein
MDSRIEVSGRLDLKSVGSNPERDEVGPVPQWVGFRWGS